MEKKIPRPADGILIAAVAALALVLWLLQGGGEGTRILVRLEGETVASYDLDRDGEYRIETPYGYNVLTVKDGHACVTQSDCSGGDCMKQELSRVGEAAACLPHKLVFEILGEDGLDAVSY